MATSTIKNPKSYTDTGFITGRVEPNAPQYNVQLLYYSANNCIIETQENGDSKILIYSHESFGETSPYAIRKMYWGSDGHLHVITGNGTDHIV